MSSIVEGGWDCELTEKQIDRLRRIKKASGNSAGRKVGDVKMERDIIRKGIEHIEKHKCMPSRKMLRKIARTYVSNSFKASKGWMDKFMKRNTPIFRIFLKGQGSN